jgi:hypothetical protein
MSPRVQLLELDLHFNDPQLAQEAVRAFTKLLTFSHERIR